MIVTSNSDEKLAHTGDLELGFQPRLSGYTFLRREDIFVKDSKMTSGIAIKMEPDLATRELDLEWILKNEPRVLVRYGWDYSSYCPEPEYPFDLPYEWSTESDTGIIDQLDDSTWPTVGRYEWYENGVLVKVRNWEYGNDDWDK